MLVKRPPDLLAEQVAKIDEMLTLGLSHSGG
jgi:hypothetical protein